MRFELVVIGASQGGAQALEVLLSSLPADFGLPIAIVQHRGKNPDEGPAPRLRRSSPLRLEEAEDKEPIQPGRVYFAPADYHLLVDGRRFALSLERPVHHARPSCDVLFETASLAFGERVIGVVLTGSSSDGSLGLARIRGRGGYAIVQQPDTAESAAMPQSALRVAGADQQLPLEQIGACLERLWRDGH